MDRMWLAFENLMLNSRFFEAHEILEDSWRQTRDSRVQTAIWVAAGFVHWQRGNFKGAVRLFTRVRLATSPALTQDVDRWLLPVQEQLPLVPPSIEQLKRLQSWARHQA